MGFITQHWDVLIEVIGWTSTVLFISSFLVKKRSVLHAVGFIACLFKMVYSYHYAVWPLFVNWVVLIGVQLYQWRHHHVAEADDLTSPTNLES
jgi:hypothetical protein